LLHITTGDASHDVTRTIRLLFLLSSTQILSLALSTEQIHYPALWVADQVGAEVRESSLLV
jgi:hypothetical protein